LLGIQHKNFGYELKKIIHRNERRMEKDERMEKKMDDVTKIY
jgi:hypothetical protein